MTVAEVAGTLCTLPEPGLQRANKCNSQNQDKNKVSGRGQGESQQDNITGDSSRVSGRGHIIETTSTTTVTIVMLRHYCSNLIRDIDTANFILRINDLGVSRNKVP